MLQSNFTQQRVFVVGEDTLFDEGVARLLTKRTDFIVSRTKFSDEHAILHTIKQELPDVILVCESGSLDPARILDLISSHAMMMRLLVVVVRISNNVIDVYEEPTFVAGKASRRPRRIIVRTGDDLLNTVRRKFDDQ